MPEFKTHVEIPIKVVFSMQKHVPRSFHEEGQTGGPIIDDISFISCDLPDEIKKYIFEKCSINLLDECWDNI